MSFTSRMSVLNSVQRNHDSYNYRYQTCECYKKDTISSKEWNDSTIYLHTKYGSAKYTELYKTGIFSSIFLIIIIYVGYKIKTCKI